MMLIFKIESIIHLTWGVRFTGLRAWKAMWGSSDPAQRAVTDRVLQGASLSVALQLQ